MAAVPEIKILNPDVIHNILLYLNVEDTMSFSSTCTYYRSVVSNDHHLWRTKFSQSWPQFYPLSESHPRTYYQEFVTIGRIRKKVYELLLRMAWEEKRNWFRAVLKDRFDCDDLVYFWHPWLPNMDTRTCQYVICILRKIACCTDKRMMKYKKDYFSFRDKTVRLDNSFPEGRYCGLWCHDYVTDSSLGYVNRCFNSKLYSKLCRDLPKEHTIEKVAVCFTQFCKTYVEVSYEKFSNALDDLTHRVIDAALEYDPDHPIKNVSKEQLEIWKCNSLSSTVWDSYECQVLLQHGLIHVVNKHLDKFHEVGLFSFLIFDISFSESKIELTHFTLIILASAIARRVGIKSHMDTRTFSRHRFFCSSNERSSTFYIKFFWNPERQFTALCVSFYIPNLKQISLKHHEVFRILGLKLYNIARKTHVYIRKDYEKGTDMSSLCNLPWLVRWRNRRQFLSELVRICDAMLGVFFESRRLPD